MARMPQTNDESAIEAEACAWIAQLDGDEPSKQDLAAFREWVNRSPRHQQEIKRLSSLWSDLNILTELAMPPNTMKKRLGIRWPIWASACTALLLMLVGGLLYYQNLGQKMPQFHSAGIGEQRVINLPDGSLVQLNTASQIKVDYGKSMREIRLLQGEAYFDVAPDAARPFTVYVRENMVRAIGTSFTVHVKPDNVEVLVTEGTVELASVSEKRDVDNLLSSTPAAVLGRVNVHQRATFGRELESIQDLRQEEITRRLSWRKGMLVFSGEPLSKVIDEMSRYTTMKIIIADTDLGDMRIGGYFRAEDTAVMLDTLETSFGIQVEYVNEKLVRLSSASS